jgi:hypothetical protein
MVKPLEGERPLRGYLFIQATSGGESPPYGTAVRQTSRYRRLSPYHRPHYSHQPYRDRKGADPILFAGYRHISFGAPFVAACCDATVLIAVPER